MRARLVETVVIRREPTGADLNAVAAVARQTVPDIAKMDGALGSDAISLLFVQRGYAAIVSREVKPKRKASQGTDEHSSQDPDSHRVVCNRAVVCGPCNVAKDSLSIGRWLNRLLRAGDHRAPYVVAFMRERGLLLTF